MKKIWIKSSIRKPEQGKKVLCFNKGDLDVRQRFKDCWAPIPYTDAKLANFDEREFWQEINFPDGFEGYMTVRRDCKQLKMDEFEQEYPEEFEEFIESLMRILKNKEDK